jgi:hypothetical protein
MSNFKISTWSVYIFNNFVKTESRILKPLTERGIYIALWNRHTNELQNNKETHLPGTRFKKSRHFVKFATNSLAWTKCATTSRPAPWIICYKYKTPVRNIIFNYNKIVPDLDVESNTLVETEKNLNSVTWILAI